MNGCVFYLINIIKLKKIIDDYSPHSSIVDYTFLEKPKN